MDILFVLLQTSWILPASGSLSSLRLQSNETIKYYNPCPINPITNVQWLFNNASGTCTYPKLIAGRGDTGQQTDIVMSLEMARAYTQSAGNPRSLFLEPAKLLNNRSLTNMSDEALAALVYAQVFVEEKWFKDYNWVHPYWDRNDDPGGGAWPDAVSLNAKRYAPIQLGSLNDHVCSIQGSDRPHRLCGLGFGPANELLGQAWDSAQWYLEYLDLPKNRYGSQPQSLSLDKYPALAMLSKLIKTRDPWLPASDARALLRDELLNVEQSQFWNVMRFVWAAARQREGAYIDNRSVDEQAKQAIDYNQILDIRPGGRPQQDVSAFSLMTTVYTDAITVSDVTGFGQTYVARNNRNMDDWKNFVNERNKAIRNVELLGQTSAEGQYRIQQALAIGPLSNQYDDPVTGDFLPYSREEIEDLVSGLLFEINNRDDPWVADEARQTLRNASLLQQGYRYYTGHELKLK